ncbi:MAG: glycosyltransferase family 39 protein [bacterium]|nr:glycosyltransferase family 39 protein [bacterium]
MLTVFSHKITEKQILAAIVILAAVLRLWGLGSAEFFHDEGFKAFRSIDYLDYIQNDDQTTPVQWFKDAPSLPWWTSLSFHDHPPLFFLIQNAFFKIFGISLFAARLPSAIAGTLSVYLLYLISKKTFFTKGAIPVGRQEKNTWLVFLPPLLLAVNLLHLWISRASLMESVQIFFILWNIYAFFRFLENRQKWKLFGLTLGLSFLTKYTSAFLLPVYAIYLLIFRREVFKWKSFYCALGLAAVLFSPVLIYNFYLLANLGHFDLQFSYLFQQETPEWRVSLGKIQDPFSEILTNLKLVFSIPFILFSLAGIAYGFYKVFGIKKSEGSEEGRGKSQLYLFWWLNIIFITLMLVAAGSGFRFIVLYSAPAVMLIVLAIDYLLSRFNKKSLLLILIAIFAAYELFFASDLFYNFPDFGIVKLDNYLSAQLGNKRSLSIPASPNPHLNKIIKSWAIKIPPADKSMLVAYDSNIGLSPRLWLFTRRNYYQGVPNFNVDQFRNFLQKEGPNAFSGYEIYFVKAEPDTILNPLFQNTSAQELEVYLTQELNLSPAHVIYGHNNLLMFKVYKFKL